MTSSRTIRSSQPGRRRRRARALAALLVPLALAAGGLQASGTAVAQPAAAHTASADRQHGLQPLQLAGLHDPSYSVTLLTGDQIHLTAAGGGRYSVVAEPRPGGGDTVTVNATGGPGGVQTLQATPSAARFLVASGQIDNGLFDLKYLAAHGYTDNANKPIPVTVQYADRTDADTITHRAGSLPASTVAATDPRTGTVDLRVDPQHVADFWAALTGTGATAATGMPPSGLADGIAHVWLTGHHTSDQQAARPDTGQPTYPLTVTMTLEPGALGNDVFSCGGAHAEMCVAEASILAVGGDNAGHGYTANWVCVDHDPCTTMRARADVPAGTYFVSAAIGLVGFYIHAHAQSAYVFAPQVTVERATSIEFDLSRLQRVDIDTPKPTEAFEGTVQWQRTLPDGRYATTMTFSAYGHHNIWAMPAPEPVTVGAFHFSTEWVLGKPTITASVDRPQRFDLHPMYQSYNAPSRVVRFSGRQRLPVVDAGYGRPQDFASIDARGKLAILRIASAGPWGPSGGACDGSGFGRVLKWQLDNAVRAGAAGVLIDPRNPGETPDGWCSLPTYYIDGSGDDDPPPDVPFATILPSEAIRLEGLLQQHDVRVTVTDGGASPYTYSLKFYEEGGIPRSLRYDIGADQLTAVDTRYHWDTPTKYGNRSLGVWRPDESFIGGIQDRFAVPVRRTEYYGPVSPDLVIERITRIWTPSGYKSGRSFDVFDQRGGRWTEDINARPVSPGPFVYDPKVPAAQQPPERFAQLCAMCRQGDAFGPIVNLGLPMSHGAALGPDSTHLYLGDEEIPQTSVPPGYPAYMLPPERHTYRLVTDYDNRDFGHTHADWTFSSAAPDHDQTPPGTRCLVGHDDPCRAEPLVFLSYDLGVALDNTLTAGRVHRFTVTASHQASDTPRIRKLKVWTSTDDGEHWKRALVVPRGRGSDGARTYKVFAAVPRLSQTNGTLSIKAQASDADGNSIEETITQAVKLTERTRGR